MHQAQLQKVARAQQLLEEASKANEGQGGDMDTVRASLQPLYQIVEACIPVSRCACYSNVPVCYSHVRMYATAAIEDCSPVSGWCGPSVWVCRSHGNQVSYRQIPRWATAEYLVCYSHVGSSVATVQLLT